MTSSSYETWKVVACVLDKIISNMKLDATSSYSSVFDSKRIPCITMTDYLNRVNYYTTCEPSCYVVAFIYIDRLLQNNPQLRLNAINAHRIMLTAITLAIKYSDDLYMSNLLYAKIGGVNLDEFNFMEAGMLALLNYDLYIDSKTYFDYLNELTLQYLKIKEEGFVMEKMEDDCEPTIKSIRSVESMGSIHTVTSMPDLAE